MTAIKLIVGLGNPGNEYENTRHNVGFWLVDQLAYSYQQQFQSESKFLSEYCKVHIAGQSVWLLKPQTFMNRSGQAIQKIASFYKIQPAEILVVHDELDLSPGTVRFKLEGGHGGHNGLRDTINQLHTKQFNRLRIGIGHPGDRNQVTHFVLHQPSKTEHQLIDDAITNALGVIELMVSGDHAATMNKLHSKN